VRVWLGEELLLDLSGAEAPAAGFAPLGLEAGLHPLRIEYLRGSAAGANTLLLEWEGPDLPRAPIPASAYVTTFDTLRDPAAPLDSDLDGIPDDLEALFTHGFGQGYDPFNPDSDGDGVIDGLEDADGDGILNAFELRHDSDPFDADANGNNISDGQEDFDGDGLDTLAELAVGTDPFVADTDGDGWNDETEITAGSDPLNPLHSPLTRQQMMTHPVAFAPSISSGPVLWANPTNATWSAPPISTTSGAALGQGYPLFVDPLSQSPLGVPKVTLNTD
jgi:hypothetical protein